MRTALFSVSFAGLWGQDRLTLEQSIDLTAELGFGGIEIMGKRPHLSPLDYSVDDCRRLRDRIDEWPPKWKGAGSTDEAASFSCASK